MTDETNTAPKEAEKETPNPGTSTETQKTETPGKENMIPQTRFNEVNNNLKDLQGRFDKMEAEQQQQQEAALAEQGKWKEIAENRLRENNELKVKASKLEEHQAIVEETLKNRVASLPEDKRALVETLPDTFTASEKLKWINDNQAILSAPPPAGDWGSGQKGIGSNGKSGQVKLSEEELATAKRFNTTPEEYAKYKD